MNTNKDIVKKELDYIILCIGVCINVKDYAELMFEYNCLSMLYEHLTGIKTPIPSSKLLSDDSLQEYIDNYEEQNNREIVDRFENEKDFICQVIHNYNSEFEGCDTEAEFSPKNQRIYLEEEAKIIILSFFKTYDKRIYDTVSSIIDNNQIQTGIKNTYVKSTEESIFFSIIDAISSLKQDDYENKSLTIFLKKVESIIKKLNSATEVSNEEYYKSAEKLLKFYSRLKTKEGIIKQEICLDDPPVLVATAFPCNKLKKSYLLVDNGTIDTETLISIVHELGHAVEESLVIFNNPLREEYDSLYLAEVPSTFFELEFIKYLMKNNIDYDVANDYLNNYYLDIYDHFNTLLDTKGATLVPNNYGEQVAYCKDNELFFIDLKQRILYGFDSYISLVLSELHKNDECGFYDKFIKFLELREDLSTSQLLEQIGVSESDFITLPFSRMSIVKKYTS